jgi:iron complex outermembrane recepter protein
MRMCVAACLAACIALLSSVPVAWAQDPQQDPQPEVSPEPVPPADSTTLPEVVVETTEQEQAAPKKKATSTSTVQGQTVQDASAPSPETGTTGRGEKSGRGPVKDYNATETATATKTDTPLNEIPQSISVVGAEQIRDMGAQTEQDVLRYLPGVVADSYGNDGRAGGSFIRGVDATEYLDGMRRTFNYYTSTYRINPYFMERVEVLRGPASVLFGQAAVGGIINSVSKLPQDYEGGEFSVDYGTFDYKQVKFDMTGAASADGKWSYRLTGLARDADTQTDYVENDSYAVQPALTFRPQSGTAITVLGHFQKDRAGSNSQFFPHIGTIFPNVNGRTISQDRFAGEPGDHYDTDVASGTLLIDHEFNEVFKLHHSSSYTDLHNDYASTFSGHFYTATPYVIPTPIGLQPDPTQEYMARAKSLTITDTQIFTQDTNLQAKFATGLIKHKVLGGIDYANYRTDSVSGSALNITPFNVYNPVYGQPETLYGYPCGSSTQQALAEMPVCDDPAQKIEQTGLYAQDQMRLGNWIALVGLRKDWIENVTDGSATLKDDSVSYRAGLMYEFASGFTPYISYAESFVPVVGNGGPFDPKEGRMYEAGFKYQPIGSSFAINAAVYDIVENNRLAPDPFDNFASTQIGEAVIKGFEIEVVGKVTKNLKVAGGYSYTQAEYGDGEYSYDSQVGTYVDVGGNQLESIPKHLASLWGVWEFDQPELRGWSVGAGVRYIGSSWDSSNTIEVPDVTLFDAMIAYEQDNWRWQITGQNLEDEEVITTCLNRGDCFLGEARTIITSLTYKY